MDARRKERLSLYENLKSRHIVDPFVNPVLSTFVSFNVELVCADSLRKTFFFGKPRDRFTPVAMPLGTMNNVVEVSENSKEICLLVQLVQNSHVCQNNPRQGAPAPLCERAVESLN